jgi:hypothetical protein
VRAQQVCTLCEQQCCSGITVAPLGSSAVPVQYVRCWTPPQRALLAVHCAMHTAANAMRNTVASLYESCAARGDAALLIGDTMYTFPCVVSTAVCTDEMIDVYNECRYMHRDKQ